jgi:hypothetical protein
MARARSSAHSDPDREGVGQLLQVGEELRSDLNVIHLPNDGPYSEFVSLQQVAKPVSIDEAHEADEEQAAATSSSPREAMRHPDGVAGYGVSTRAIRSRIRGALRFS